MIPVPIKFTMPSRRAIVSSTVHAVCPSDYCVKNLQPRRPPISDLSADYGNEVESGQGVARAIKEGIVKREDLFLVSKLWNTYHSHEHVEPICKKQLHDWGIDYFDLYIVHFPISLKYVDPSERYPPGFTYDGEKIIPGNATIQETWQAMEKVQQHGLARSIGISNFNGQLIMDLLRYAKIKPATLQIEHHPYLTQSGLVKYAQEQDIAITAYSSFGPQSFRELNMKQAHDTPLLFENPTIVQIAEKHGKTPAQVLLRWATQREVAVIPKSNNEGRLKQNLDVTGWDLEREEVEKISGLDQHMRFNDPVNVSGCFFFVGLVCELSLMSAVVWFPTADLCLEVLARCKSVLGAGRLLCSYTCWINLGRRTLFAIGAVFDYVWNSTIVATLCF